MDFPGGACGKEPTGGACGKEPTCQCRRCKRRGFDPGSGKSPGGGHGSPLQYSCLQNPMDRGPWWATVHGVTKSQTHLKQLSMYAGYARESFYSDEKAEKPKCMHN